MRDLKHTRANDLRPCHRPPRPSPRGLERSSAMRRRGAGGGFRACVRGGSSEVTVACMQASLRRHAQVAIGGLCAPVLLGLLLCLAAR
jgi:hypothetical protein